MESQYVLMCVICLLLYHDAFTLFLSCEAMNKRTLIQYLIDLTFVSWLEFLNAF